MKALVRGSLAVLINSAALLVAPAAFADGEACINDIDCPGAACGDPVCNWNKPQGMKFTCNPAGTDAKGKDGWCTTNADCKCMGVGANCSKPPYCSFTKASDAPVAAGGSPGAGGSTAAGGSTSTAGSATTPPAESSGCSMGAPGRTTTGVAVALGLMGLGVAFARRRR